MYSKSDLHAGLYSNQKKQKSVSMQPDLFISLNKTIHLASYLCITITNVKYDLKILNWAKLVPILSVKKDQHNIEC